VNSRSPFAASRAENNFGSAAGRGPCPRSDIFLPAQKCDIRLWRVIYFAFAKCDIFRLREMLRKTLTRFDFEYAVFGLTTSVARHTVPLRRFSGGPYSEQESGMRNYVNSRSR
jgi:hypothetical protein